MRAIPVPLESIAAMAALGTSERRFERVVNGAPVIERGRVVERYAKRYPNEPGVITGRARPVFGRDGVRYGINICNDANYPEGSISSRRPRRGVICYPLDNMLSPDIAARWHSRSGESAGAANGMPDPVCRRHRIACRVVGHGCMTIFPRMT